MMIDAAVDAAEQLQATNDSVVRHFPDHLLPMLN
jgi:hypothetical protein